MDMFNLLKQDHETARQGLKSIINGQTTDQQQVKKVCNELLLHMEMEEALLYPRLRNEEETRDLIQESVTEHQQVRTMLQQMARTSLEPDRIRRQVEEVLENIEHHVVEEENELFPMIQRMWGKEQITNMGNEMVDFKNRSKTKQFV